MPERIQIMRESKLTMNHNLRRKFLLLLGTAAVCLPLACAQSEGKEKDKEKEKEKQTQQDGESTRLRVEVTAGEKGEPVDSASVYIKFQKERFLAKDKMIEMNMKTNREGIAKIPSVPRGKVLVQVIAPGWKTYGKWYDLTEREHVIKVNLQKPLRWY